MLRANGVPTTVLDLDPEQIDTLRRFGLKVFYGDAGRLDLLHAAGIDQARLMLLAIDESERASEIAAQLRHHFPHLKILARANSLHHAYELAEIGVDQVFRETYDTALDMGVEALKALGFRAYQAHRAAHTFKKHEEQTFAELSQFWGDRKAYTAQVRERISELDRVMQSDERDFGEKVDHAWEAAAPKENS